MKEFEKIAPEIEWSCDPASSRRCFPSFADAAICASGVVGIADGFDILPSEILLKLVLE
ncbi:hypothetical protein [Rhizobium sp. H4]|uniref:hypothetical protein n=1 Tax=Rhizobium sp. H4 TaxID=2035449 RepID=UPI00131DB38E|nr:hypothetical protein [Rhizobium sp. H4]